MIEKKSKSRVAGMVFGFSTALFTFTSLVYFFMLGHYISHVLTYFEWMVFVFLLYALYLSITGVK